MSRARNYLVGSVLAAVAVGASLALFASSAGAGPAGSTVTVSTQIQGAPDTSISPTGLCEAANGSVVSDPPLADQLPCAFGPVWATDTYTDKFQIKALGGGQYSVQRQANGTFTAFAQPNSGLSTPLLIDPSVTGQFHGTISYTVTSTHAPVAPTSPEPVGTTGSSVVLHQIFGADAVISGGGDWVFAYNTANSRMVQAWNTAPATWGNITG
jgi:cytoskeletal protein RodZ